MQDKYSSNSQIFLEQTKIIQKRKGYSGVYIHFPFCIQKCSYCDFYSIGSGIKPSVVEKNIFQTYKQELQTRLAENQYWHSYIYDTIFFGGGTPSRMDLLYLEDFIHFLKTNLKLSHDLEMTLEANPEDVTEDNVKAWQKLGFTRINMGYQSRNPKYLQYVGRYYDPDHYKNAPKILTSSGISETGYDLIYGFPGQKEEEFYSDLDFLLSFRPTHISMYSLTLEKGTEYSRQVREGKKIQPEEDLQIKILESLPSIMNSKGYEWYEVSNYCLPGHRSRHNLRYWMMEPYLGLGPGAHGYDGHSRYGNARNLEAYTKDPTITKQETADYSTELFLSLFRIFAPIQIESFLWNQAEQVKSIIDQKLKAWSNRKLAYYENGIFQWKSHAVMYLDSYILELTRALEENSTLQKS